MPRAKSQTAAAKCQAHPQYKSKMWLKQILLQVEPIVTEPIIHSFIESQDPVAAAPAGK